MKEKKSSLRKTLALLVSVCLMVLTGCGYTIVKKDNFVVLPESRVGESHPTKPGYECYPTGYLLEIEKEIELCLSGN